MPQHAEIILNDGQGFVRILQGKRHALFPLSKDGRHYMKPAEKWTADVRLAGGSRKRFRFSANKDAAAVMLSELLKKIENEKAGIVDRYGEHRKRVLKGHLEDWTRSLEASGRPPKYIGQRFNRIEKAFMGCGFLRTQDLTAERLEIYLHGLRTTDDLSVQTTNDWLQAIRQFCRWMVGNGRMERDPFTRLKPGNAKADVRLRRGEFTEAECRKLLATAEGSKDDFRGIVGSSRAMLYRVALKTGYRVSELASLTPDSFDLDAKTPAIVLAAEFTKNRSEAVQPIPTELALALRAFLAA